MKIKLSKIIADYRGLPRSIYALFFAIMVNRMGNFVIPFLAMYLTRNLHYTPDKTGFFVMLVSLAALPGIFLGGVLVDRVGRKNVLVLFQFLSACCFIPCVFVTEASIVPWLLVLSVFFTETAQVAHNAMVTDLTCNQNRKEAFALIYLGINIGFSIGPIVAGFLFNHYIKIFFLIDSLTTIASVALILLFTRKTIPSSRVLEAPDRSLDNGERAETGNTFKVLIKRPFFLAFMAISFLYTFIYIQDGFSLPLYLDKLFSYQSSHIYGVLMTANAVFVVCASTLISFLTRNNRAAVNIALAGILYGIGFGMIYFIHSFFMFVISTLIWTTGEILASVNTSVYLSGHSPVSHRGRFNSVRLFVRRAGMAFGPLAMGIFIRSNGLRNVWPVVFILSLAAVAGVYVMDLVEKAAGRKVMPEDTEKVLAG